MKIFPHTLTRIGGETYEEWARMSFKGTNAKVDGIVLSIQDKERMKQELSEGLFTFIETQEDPKTQNLIQNLRRDIFNDRKLKNNKISTALKVLPAGIGQKLDRFMQLQKEIKAQVAEGEINYLNETAENRKVFKDIVTNELLQKGLILSSRSLLDRIDSYIGRDVNQLRKKELKTEQGLIKYFTRMFAKTSPFSTFTNLSIARVSPLEDKTHDIRHKDSPDKVKGHIRLNNYLLKYLLDLFKSYRAAYRTFYLRPNPTVEQKQDHFFYLTNNNNIEAFQRIPYNPVVELILESVRASKEGIRFDQLVEMLLEQIDAGEEELEAYVKQLLDFGFLEYNIGVSGIDPDWDLKLLPKLEDLVEKGVPHIGELVTVLRKIRKLGERYASAGLGERKEILSEAFDDFRAICMKVHEAAGLPAEERRTEEERMVEWRKQQEEKKKEESKAKEEGDPEKKEGNSEDGEGEEEEKAFKHTASTLFSFKPEQVFYEDTTREVTALLDEGEVERFIKNLDDIQQALRIFRGMQDEKDKMRHFFLQKYGEEPTVDLLTFYEDYFREFKKPEKEREERQKKEAAERARATEEAKEKNGTQIAEETKDDKAVPAAGEDPIIPSIKARQEAMKSWSEAYEKEIGKTFDSTHEEVNLSLAALQKACEDLPPENGTVPENSYGCFVQFFEDPESKQLKAMLNASFSGYGKMMSRFLHIFDEEVTHDLRRWNLSLKNGNAVFVEDCDASYFNANLHPPLMPYEIWMPGGHNTLPPEQQLPITDFEVRYDGQKDGVTLWHRPSGRQAYVFDLGFQGHMGRSQLFQLLEKFTKAEYLFTHPLVRAVNNVFGKEADLDTKEEASPKEDGNQPRIIVSPRVIFENQIVLQRKGWHIPRALIPMKAPTDSDWDYYLKVNLWRKAQDMPDEVFIFINTNRWGKEEIDPKLGKRLTKDDYKPQYIDFTNPLLVTLFEKTVVKVPSTMKIEEMLPNSDQMLRIDGQRYVSEFVVQWYGEATVPG